MAKIIVGPLSQIEEIVREQKPHEMISLVNAGMHVVTPATVTHHLVMNFNDINRAEKGLTIVDSRHVEAIIKCALLWDQRYPFFVHCWMGVSRSPAAAYVMACALHRKGRENELAFELRKRAPFVTPNLRLVGLADELLGREGRMVDAIQSIGRGEDVFEGTAFCYEF